MIVNIYSIKDNKTGIFGVPFASSSDIQATRQFARLTGDSQVQISHFPSDYDLYIIATFDDNSGKICLKTDEYPNSKNLDEFPIFIIGGMSAKKMLERS